jgi:ABC-type phosphate transport system substrate-binding protein
MIKKLLKATVVGASMFAMVGAASAATQNINIYGASAQYNFWNDAADNFLLQKGCTSIQKAAGSGTTKNHGITRGTCGSDTWYIRYSAKASYDGIRAMKCMDPDGTSGCTNPCERKLADETTTNWSTGVVTSLACKDVNIGASDVEAGAIAGMESHGQLKGHMGGGDVDRVMDASTIYDTGLKNYRPIVVPFAFFKNISVPYSNLSKMMAVHIFSGQIWDWSDFDDTVASQAVTVCLRHAGSGTHATLNAVVMAKSAPLLIEEDSAGNSGAVVWFNDSSSDMVKCVEDLAGSVGYADADQTFNAAKATRMTYEGVTAEKKNIVNGQYPFWSAQWLYVDAIVPGSPIHQLATWAANPANMPSTRQAFWAAKDEMLVDKANSFSFPVRQ